MPNQLEQVYNLYLSKGLISDAIDLNKFTEIDDNQRQQLYDLGKNKGLFDTTDFGTFSNAWASATMQPDMESALEDEVVDKSSEIVFCMF